MRGEVKLRGVEGGKAYVQLDCSPMLPPQDAERLDVAGFTRGVARSRCILLGGVPGVTEVKLDDYAVLVEMAVDENATFAELHRLQRLIALFVTEILCNVARRGAT